MDCRKLNTQTFKDNYPLTRIDDQLDRLINRIYFCSLDLQAGYLPVTNSGKFKNVYSFCYTYRTIQVQSYPFWVNQKVFQRFMNRLLMLVGASLQYT